MGLSPAETATTVLLLGQSGFYSMGRDNSIASLDLLNGFNGLGESSLAAVMVQTILSNWVGPVWWSFAGLRLLALWPESQGITTIEVSGNGHRVSGNANIDHTAEYQTVGHGSEAVEISPTPPKVVNISNVYLEYLSLQTMFSALSSLALTLSCIYMWGQEDLWNIYAPKFINASLWAFFHQLLVHGLSCSLVWILAGN